MNEQPISNVDLSHHIQRHVLMQLRQMGEQTYQQLKVDGLEGNGFNYHLKLLKQAGLVENLDSKYMLSPTGHLVTDAFSFDKQRLVMRPHHFTYILVTQGEYVLVYEPTRQPSSGYLCLLSGKLHYGDSIEASIHRETRRRNLSTGSTTYRLICPINTRYSRNGSIVSHRPGIVWHVEYAGERVTSQTASGSSYWVRADELENYKTLPDIRSALEHLHTGDHGPIEGEFTL